MKIIKLSSTNIEIEHCGFCPFFEWDTQRGEYHTCKLQVADRTLYVETKGIHKCCPLENKDQTVRFLDKFGDIKYNGVTFKGCDTWQL